MNTGFYIIEPEMIKLIPEDQRFHMTDLIDLAIEKGERVGVYPISESSWMDMGQVSEMKKMISHFENINN